MRRFLLRLLAFVRSGRADAELTREIDAHLRLLEDEFIAKGMSADEARLAARRAFGGQVEQTKFRQRDARSFRHLDELALDIKLGVRMLLKYPGLTLVGGIGMAVAIAISASFFASLYAYLYSRLPLDEGARIVALENWDVEANNEERQALHDYVAWRDEMSSMEKVAAFRTIGRNLIVPGGTTEPVRIAAITASAFGIARVAPLLGRPLLDDDEQPGGPAVVVIGYDVWQSRFAADPAVIGREVRFGNTLHTVVGVMPEGFAFPINDSYWVPFRANPASYQRGDGPEIFIFGRLAPGATVEDAQAELTTIGRRSAAAYPKTHARLSPRVLPYAHPILDIQDASLVQFGVMQAILSVLLIVVSVNIGVLIYARTASRQSEIAVRTALGASRRRLVLQLFIEAVVLSASAATLGLGLTKFGLGQAHLIVRLEGAQIPYWIDFGLPAAAVVYVVGLSLLAAVIAGVLPALNATGRRVQTTLRRMGGGSGLRLGKTWTALIVLQVAFAVAALPIAIAYAWSEVRSVTTAPSFAVEQFLVGVHSMDPDPPLGIEPSVHRQAAFARLHEVQNDLRARLESEYWVSDVTLSLYPPGDEVTTLVEVSDPSARAVATPRQVTVNEVDIDFFEAFDARVVSGRAFTSADFAAVVQPSRRGSATAATSRRVIVNRTFAEKLLNGGNAVGGQLRYVAADGGRGEEMSEWYEIVGVVSDLHSNSFDPKMVEAVVYHALVPGTQTRGSIVVRTSGGAAGRAERLRELTAAVDPTVRLTAFPLVDRYRQMNVAVRLVAIALALVTFSVLLLSAAGIYAMMSFAVAQRRKEIGIRTALGADGGQILRSIFGRAAAQLAAGIGLGIAAALLIDAASGGKMLGPEGTVVVPVISALTLTVGLLASIGPARQGLRLQPTQALREE